MTNLHLRVCFVYLKSLVVVELLIYVEAYLTPLFVGSWSAPCVFSMKRRSIHELAQKFHFLARLNVAA